ncbi:MAG: alpha/beta fold hydrolase [Chloroflexota bacterium]
MSIDQIRFSSHGMSLAATLTLPAAVSVDRPGAAVVQGPGWLGLRDAKLYQPYHEALLAAGIAVLVFDYRGFGDSEGDATLLDPRAQVEDYRSAATYLETRADIDPARIGAFGSGATGGGNAIMAAGLDPRFKAIVSQVPIADGRDWLHRMRREYEWLEFLARLRQDRLARVLGGTGELVPPREGIMVPTPERKTTTVKADVDGRIPALVALASADAILEYRPIEFVDRIAPRAAMFICVENDAVTPEDHAFRLYERAGGPKRLVVQTGTTHYGAYAQYRDIVAPLIAEWFTTHLRTGQIHLHEAPSEASVTYLGRP